MKKYLTLSLIFVCIVITLQPYKAIANNAAAGEISYEWVSDSTYRFYFKFYRDCSGNAEPATVPLCFHNPCDNTQSFSITLSKTTTTGNVLPIKCYKVKTRCDSVSSAIPGYQEWTYSELATLPARCNAWHIFTYVANRNNSSNIQNPTTKPYYAEARFNNTGSFQGNSSPKCTTSPIIYTVLYNGISNYNSTAIDPDGDSLVTEVIDPQTGVINCTDTVSSNVSYTTPSKPFLPKISIPWNPFQTSNSFRLTPTTGDISFFRYDTARSTAALRISEYRNGILIGSITREIQVQVFYFPYVDIVITVPNFTPPNYTTSSVIGCPNVPLTFSFWGSSTDTNSMLWVKDDFATSLPGSSVTYINQGTDSVKGTVTWTPAINDRGFIYIRANVIDSFCRPPGNLSRIEQKGVITVADTLLPIRDTTICLGDKITFVAYGGDFKYSWQELPNGNPGTIDCNWSDCKQVDVRPNQNTRYVLTSGLSCPPVVMDTITVNVNPNVKHPYITMTMDPSTRVTPATKVTFTATSFNCANPTYKWFLNNQEIPGIIGTTYSRSGLTYGDKIYCRLICKDSCSIPRDTFSNDGLVDETIIGKISTSSTISIYPNPNHGSFILSGKINASTCDIVILNTLGQVRYKHTFPVYNGLLKEQISLELASGIYLLKINNTVQRFVINDH